MWESTSIAGLDLEIFEPATPRIEGAVLLFRGRKPIRWAEQAEWTRHLNDVGLRAIAPHRIVAKAGGSIADRSMNRMASPTCNGCSTTSSLCSNSDGTSRRRELPF
jgi:hypothetical protein